MNILPHLRKLHKISQEKLAKRLGISRPTLSALEKGDREPNLSDLKTLSEVFDISIESLIRGEIPEEKNPDIRITIPQKNIEKFKEVFLYILEKVGGKPNIGMTVLYKLLYFIDFDYYEKYEEQLMGLTYIKNHHGPTPKEFVKVIEEMKRMEELDEIKSKYFTYEQRKFLPLKKPDLSKLNGQELELIDDVLARLSGKSAKELSDYSHGDVPWLGTDDLQPIDYEAVFYRNDPYSVRQYEDEL